MTNTLHRIHGSRSIPDAVFSTTGKPDAAGGPLSGPTFLWKLVVAGGLVVCIREAGRSGRPSDDHTLFYMEAGLCRRPYYIQMGRLTLQEALISICTYVEAGLRRRPCCVYKGRPANRDAR